MDLRDLKFLLAHYEVGSWFHIPDDFWSKKGNPRPFVVRLEWTGQPNVQIYPRSTSPGGSSRRRIPHAAHSRGHEPRCAINQPGWIVRDQISVPSSRLQGTYSCQEPPGLVLAQLR
jgi:hypothetical protein